MRCSSCSAHVMPVVALDIDGTLGDYHGHFMRFAVAYMGMMWVPGMEHDEYDGSEPHREYVCRELSITPREFRDIKLAYRQGAQKRSMPLYNGARELVWLVRRLGAEAWLTTTRPYLRLDNIDPDTRAWLDFSGIRYDGLLFHEDKYNWLASNVDKERVVAVLDDLPEQYDAAANAFGSQAPILRRTTYNRAVVRPMMAEDLGQAASIIGERIAFWKEQHG